MNDGPQPTPARRAERAARERRRAEALRQNLRRRKEQARARTAPVSDRIGRDDDRQPEGNEPPLEERPRLA